jgi:hypothetical protein
MKAGIDVHTIKDGHVYKAKDFGILDHMMSEMGAYLSDLESEKKRDRLNAAWENDDIKNFQSKKSLSLEHNQSSWHATTATTATASKIRAPREASGVPWHSKP